VSDITGGTNIIDPWLQRDNETAKAYKAFSIFRDLGARRTFAEAYRRYSGRTEVGKHIPGYFRDWYAEHDWKDRVRAYDQSLDDEVREAIRVAYREAFTTLARSAKLHVGTVIEMAAGRRAASDNLPEDRVAVGEAAQLAAARDALDRLGVRAPDRIDARVEEGTGLTSWVDLLRLATEDSDDG
jgi:hypothetical protein